MSWFKEIRSWFQRDFGESKRTEGENWNWSYHCPKHGKNFRRIALKFGDEIVCSQCLYDLVKRECCFLEKRYDE